MWRQDREWEWVGFVNPVRDSFLEVLGEVMRRLGLDCDGVDAMQGDVVSEVHRPAGG